MSATIVIFGASGDLTSRKLIPALYMNFKKKRLPENTRIIGFARRPYTDDIFREKMRDAIREFAPSEFDEGCWNRFAPYLFYQPGPVDRVDGIRALAEKIRSDGVHDGPTIFYFAIAPQLYPEAVNRLADAHLIGRHDRLIVEKPFGSDLASAIDLNSRLLGVVKEDQIYRIDHYLGKETVQNLLVFRFGNAIFEPLWNRNFIDHVQITVSETVGVEHRASYYDTAGILRDMFQNHLLQLLTLVAMEPPATIDADDLRNEKVKVLRSIRDIAPEMSSHYTVRGQYEGYRSEQGVNPESTTETFGVVEFFIDNWRWQGVPFYLRSGKMLKEKISEVVIQFRRPPRQMFDIRSGATELSTNHLSICIQPDEGFHLRFITKIPDGGMTTRPADMNFHFGESFRETAIPESYERLLLDALNGDASLFTRNDEIELAWKIIDLVREGWEGSSSPPLQFYTKGSWGPDAADPILWRNGRWWIHDCADHNRARVENAP